MDFLSNFDTFFSTLNASPWDAESSSLDTFWGENEDPFLLAPLIVPEPLGLPEDIDSYLDPVDFTQPEPESEPNPLDEEKRKAADAARAERLRLQLAHGRSFTFLTRGLDLGDAPTARKTLLGQGW